MSRPRQTAILKTIDRRTHRTEEVIEAEYVYAVYHGDVPINLRVSIPGSETSTKYPKTTFVNSAHATRLANRLNKQFSTNSFSVRILK
jgi:hypothetical protein